MRSIILCGGYGTRISDVSENIPKTMIRIGHYPILWHYTIPQNLLNSGLRHIAKYWKCFI